MDGKFCPSLQRYDMGQRRKQKIQSTNPNDTMKTKTKEQDKGNHQATSSAEVSDTTTRSTNLDITKVVEIVDKYRHGVLNADVEEFNSRPNQELNKDNLEPAKVVEIIRDSRSINNTLDRTIREEASTSRTNQNTPPSLYNDVVEKYNEINANYADNL